MVSETKSKRTFPSSPSPETFCVYSKRRRISTLNLLCQIDIRDETFAKRLLWRRTMTVIMIMTMNDDGKAKNLSSQVIPHVIIQGPFCPFFIKRIFWLLPVFVYFGLNWKTLNFCTWGNLAYFGHSLHPGLGLRFSSQQAIYLSFYQDVARPQQRQGFFLSPLNISKVKIMVFWK